MSLIQSRRVRLCTYSAPRVLRRPVSKTVLVLTERLQPGFGAS
jgi:hypothetical protein